jgi:hypothetical protein
MSIDWSKAPEGATHWDTGMNFRVAGWMKLDDGIWYWWPVKDAKCDMKWHASLNQHMIKLEDFIARPSSWNGEGLPPVGTVCEMTTNDGYNWRPVEIIFSDDYIVLVGQADGRVDRKLFRRSDADVYFRPVRTPEQIEDDERVAALNQMIGCIKDHPNKYTGVSHLSQLKIQEDACIDLYQARYRKVTP